MVSPSIAEIYGVVVHPIITVMLFAFGMLGWVMALQLNRENIDLKRRLGRLPVEVKIDYLKIALRYYYIVMLYYSFGMIWLKIFFHTKRKYVYAKIY